MHFLFSTLLSLFLGFSLLHADDAFRYKKKGVALESAENKGLTYDDVASKDPLSFPRPLPLPHFSKEGKEAKAGSIEKQTIHATLTKSASTQVTTGFPFPEGGIFNPENIRVLNASHQEIPAQVEVTSFWPDGSIKWALLNFSAQDQFSVEFGNAVQRHAFSSPLHLSKEGSIWTIQTGRIEAQIDTEKFNGLQSVASSEGNKKLLASFSPEGIRLLAENGEVFSTAQVPPSKVTVEQEGIEKIVLRIEGAYANSEGKPWMRYVTRLTFRANSPKVEIAHQHINDVLTHEFTDFKALEMPVELTQKIKDVRLLLSNQNETTPASSVRVFQEDENRSTLTEDGKSRASRRSPGALQVQTEGGGSIGIVVEDFWQRWPKALGAHDHEVNIELLPKLPDRHFGNDLPAHLMYPFVNGNYRMKWGMSFTERVTLDFSDTPALKDLAESVSTPPIAIIPSSWYAETGALGIMAPQEGKEFAEWDDFFEQGYQAYMKLREVQREYGFMNYGDWFGERSRNWGNNEYDTAHSFFMQFARTGNPDYYHLALTAARHQSEVDIIHAYPDPHYIGANHQHSIGHTGTWSQVPKFATWSHAYDTHTDATNGHTWAEGMTEAWYLAGDAGVMESVLQLGEHIAWAVAPTFKISPLYPRSAGWSLRAIVAIYRATGDPEYLKAAGSIAHSAMEAQDDSGIWQRNYKKMLLPSQQSTEEDKEEIGISNFQLGLTLAGLVQYYQVTKNQEVKDAILRGVKTLAKAWSGSGAWPYVIRQDGTPSPSRPTQSVMTNILNVESIAYMGWENNDPYLLNIAQEVLLNSLFYDEPSGKKPIVLRSAQALLGALHAAYKKNGTHWPGENAEKNVAAYFKGIPYARKFDVRGPGTLTFLLKSHGKEIRLPLLHSASKGEAHLSLRTQDGTLLSQQTVSLAEKKEVFYIDIPERAEGESSIFLLEIKEPDRGVWNIDASALAGIMMKVDPTILLSNISIAKYAISIPKDTQTFDITVRGTHRGVFGVGLLDAEGQVLGFYRGTNRSGEAITLTGTANLGELQIKLSPKEQTQPLSLVLWAGYDIQITPKEGLALWIARNPSEIFQP